MNRKLILLFALFLVMTQAESVLACAACYGQSDSAMATGMNWGIFSLMGVIVMVLGGLSTFFVFLARRPVIDPQPPVEDGKNPSENEHGTL